MNKKVIIFIVMTIMIGIFTSIILVYKNGLDETDLHVSNGTSNTADTVFIHETLSESNRELKTSKNNYINDYSEVEIEFKITNGNHNGLYVVKAEIDTENLAFQSDDKSVSIYIDDESDINSKYVHSNSWINYDKLNTIFIKRAVKLDDKGELSFKIKFGTNENLVKGSYDIKNLSINLAAEDSDYKLIKSKDKKIEMLVYQSDLEISGIDSSIIYDAIEILSKLRASILSFIGNKEPYEGITTYICTENIPTTGLSGNPIYINRMEITSLLSTLVTSGFHGPYVKSDFFPVLCHELSHTFDDIESQNINATYNFDRELFATLKSIYALKTNKLEIAPSFLSIKPSLKTGIYNHEALLSKIILVMKLLENDKNWEYIEKTISYFYNNEPNKLSDIDTFELFIVKLSEYSGMNIRESFEDTEWQTLMNHFRMK